MPLLFRSAAPFSIALAVLVLTAAGCGSASTSDESSSEGAPSAAAPGPPSGGSEQTAEPGPTPATPASERETSQQETARPAAAEDLPDEAGRRKPGRLTEPSLEGPKLGVNPLRDEGDGDADDPPDSAASKPAKRSGKGKQSDEPFDPVKENGPIFEGWPDPKLALVITGRQDGYLEPCGCAGLDQMKGGLTRRHSMFEDLRKRGWPVAGVDVGGLIKGFSPQTELKFHLTIDAMKKMGYDAIAFGKSDLQLLVEDLLSVAASTDGQPSLFPSANVALFGFDAGLTARERIIEVGGMRLGVTSVLGKRWQEQIHNSDIALADPAEKLAEVVPGLKQQSDLLILLAHATREESIELARRFPFDIVVTADGPAEPPAEPGTIEGSKALLIDVGEKGMNAVVLGFYDDAAKPIRYQRVPLDSRFRQSDYVVELMRQYQQQLKALGLEGLSVSEAPHPGQELLGGFVGTAECKSCHEESYDVWKKSGHAKAWKTLVELDPPRNFDPECISCHVVGWHPTHYFPYKTGFLSEEKTPQLVNVGCESCHGPGQKHVEAEMGSDLELQRKLQEAMVITKEESEKRQCMTCHDLDNSPDFDFKTYWPDVEHEEE